MKKQDSRKKQTCNLCGKRLVKLSQHMYLMHNIALSVQEPLNLKDFLKLCTHLPIPTTLWSFMMENNGRDIEKYMQGEGELPTELFHKLYELFDKYQRSGTKLILATRVNNTDDCVSYKSASY